MNNINCEHCGTLIDVKKSFRCPSCGAPYKNNKQYKEYLDYKKKQKEIDLETQKVDNEIKKDSYVFRKKMTTDITIIVILIIICSFSAFFAIMYNIFKQTDSIKNNQNSIIPNLDSNDIPIDNINDQLDDILNNITKNNNSQESDKVNVLYNEIAYTDEYNIKINNIIEYKDKLNNDKLYYGFHIEFKNKSDNWKSLFEIKLIGTDNNGNNHYLYQNYVFNESLETLATDQKTYEGYVYFDVPETINDVIINYDNVDITINDFRNKIKK